MFNILIDPAAKTAVNSCFSFIAAEPKKVDRLMAMAKITSIDTSSLSLKAAVITYFVNDADIISIKLNLLRAFARS
tara:strand:- start:3447 stop:3674 length:228 start_codon:yes stop_codon:yes gene_type:complete